MKKLVLALAFVLPSVVQAAEVCLASVTLLEAFESPYDQQQRLQRAALDLGPAAVQTAVVSAPRGGVREKYLVVYTVCDAFGDVDPHASPKRRAAPSSVVIPDDHPYEWESYSGDNSDALVAEYQRHATAAARGILSLGNGSMLVYWTKVER